MLSRRLKVSDLRTSVAIASWSCVATALLVALFLPTWFERVQGYHRGSVADLCRDFRDLMPSRYDMLVRQADILTAKLTREDNASIEVEGEEALMLLNEAMVLRPLEPAAYATRSVLNTAISVKAFCPRYEQKYNYKIYKSEAESDLNRAIELTKSPQRRAQFLLRRATAGTGRTDEQVIADCSAALNLVPNSTEAFVCRAQRYLHGENVNSNGRYTLAVADFSKAIQLGTDRQLTCLEGLARSYHELRDQKNTLLYTTKALDILDKVDYHVPHAWPEDDAMNRTDMLKIRAEVHKAMNRPELANADIAQSTKTPPRPAIPWHQSLFEELLD